MKSHKQIWKTNSDKNRATEIYKSVKISPALFLQCWHHILIFWIQNPVLDLNHPIKVHLNILSERGTCEGKEDNRYMGKKFHKAHICKCARTHTNTHQKNKAFLASLGCFEHGQKCNVGIGSIFPFWCEIRSTRWLEQEACEGRGVCERERERERVRENSREDRPCD